MNLLDRLTCTQVASWSDRKRHTQLLTRLLQSKEVSDLQKVYLLGHAEASTQTIAQIATCVKQKSGRCLRQLFQDLPYGEDEFGLTPIGPMCTVYLLIEPNNQLSVAVIGSTELGVSPSRLLLLTSAEGFPHWLIMRKRLVIDS
jgi:hypothetical protein